MSTQENENLSDIDRVDAIKNLGVVILCGGRSQRMGIDKSQLVFGNKSFLECIVDRVGEVSDQIVVVRNSKEIPVPQLSENVLWERDEHPNFGPLEGIRVGLRRLAGVVDYAFVTSCDVPLLKPLLIRNLFDRLDDFPAIVPVDRHRVYGMTAIYRTDLHLQIESRIRAGQLRVSELADALGALRISTETLLEVDPTLDSMTNVNSAADYLQLLERFGQTCPAQIKAQLNRRHS